MRRSVWMTLALALFASCDPIWSVQVEVNDPGDTRVPGASVALVCEGTPGDKSRIAETDKTGVATISGVGADIPRDCDVQVSHPDAAPLTISYREMCPEAPGRCERTFRYRIRVAPCISNCTRAMTLQRI